MASPVSLTHLTKTFRGVRAVRDLSVEFHEGRITGFLGPNGAGKSTTLRCLLGLARPTSGEATLWGVPYRELRDPLRQVGVVLDTKGFLPSASGLSNLRVIQTGIGVAQTRIDEVLDLVDLEGAQHRPVKTYSLGMKQRLSLAAALLGDPPLLILDEPANGLDPLGIAWLRTFLRSLQEQGRTVIVSSHQLAEMQNTVDDVVIIHRGSLVTQGTLADVTQGKTLEEAFLAATEGMAA